MSKGKYTKTTKISGYKPLALLLALALLMGCAIGGTIAWLTDKTQEVKNTFTTSNIDITLEETGTTENEDTGNESKNYTMVPGWTMSKDPVVTVSGESEDCYLFVKVVKSGSATLGTGQTAQTLGIDDYLAYNLATEDTNAGWTQLKGADNKDVPNVYYRIVNKADTTKAFHLLLAGSIEGGYSWKQDEVLTRPTVTKEMMDALKVDGAVEPSITFTAYASQLWKTNKPTKTTDMTEAEYTTAVANAQFTPAEAWSNVNPTT